MDSICVYFIRRRLKCWVFDPKICYSQQITKESSKEHEKCSPVQQI